MAIGKKSYINFNPRSHERSDYCSAYCSNDFAYFNPRSHERSDDIFSFLPSWCLISIHAPTRGATELAKEIINGVWDFNPRSHERSDL